MFVEAIFIESESRKGGDNVVVTQQPRVQQKHSGKKRWIGDHDPARRNSKRGDADDVTGIKTDSTQPPGTLSVQNQN